MQEFWTAYWAASAFIFGAVTGSFLNVCIWRLPRGESLSDPPSHCPSCNHRLKFWPDMVPIFSQLAYRSRCRYCGARFSWRYLWVELATGLAFLAVQLRYTTFTATPLPETDLGVLAVIAMLFVAALVVVFVIDLDHYVIIDGVLIIALALALIKDGLLIWRGVRPLWQTIPGTDWTLPLPLSVIGALAGFWLLWQFTALATAYLGREAMGSGDPLLLGVMGAFLIPWPLLLFAFIVAIALGTVSGVTGMLLSVRSELKAEAATATGPAVGAETPPPQAVDVGEGVGTATDGTPGGTPGGMPPSEESGSQTFSAERAEIAPPAANLQTDEPECATVAESGTPGAEAPGDEKPTRGPSEMPALPRPSRVGRVLVVAGGWLGLGGIWMGGVWQAQGSGAWIGVMVGSVVIAAALIALGAKQWVASDREWSPKMDQFFEESTPGPRVIPFGPFLVIGTLAAMLIGNPVVQWYMQSQLGMGPLPWPWE